MAGARGGGAAIEDVSDLGFRLRTLRIGISVSHGMCLAVGVYAALTWERPHRALIVWMLGVSVAWSLALWQAPIERIVRGRSRELFFVGWSISIVGFLTGAVLADGGGRSPLAFGFVLPVVFAALSYPLGAVILVSAVDLLACTASLTLTPHSDAGFATLLGCTLACTAVMCVWQARNHSRQREELARVSRADPLTGCLNRRGFEERLDAELSRTARSAQPLALLLLDLDHLKEINDSSGHAAGDALLVWAAETMRTASRGGAAVGRLGGDEFAILLPDTGRDAALMALARVRAALHDRAPASGGVASFPEDGVNREGLFHRADLSLYSAKRERHPRRTIAPRDLSWAAALARAVDERMAVQHEHSSAVAGYSAAIGERLGWSEPDLSLLRLAAMLHDIGKVAVPDSILRKRGALDDREFAEVARHPVIGSEIIGRIEGLRPIVRWIRHSHEHLDGSGYPDNLMGEAVPPASRILLVADAYDAMTSDRSYRRAMTHQAALAELRRHAGTQFDPDCVAALGEHLDGQRAGTVPGAPPSLVR